MKRIAKFLRSASFVLAGGTLAQTGSCAIDTQTVAADLVSSVATAVINDLVFGAFNLQ
jgi:hypothetical protein